MMTTPNITQPARRDKNTVRSFLSVARQKRTYYSILYLFTAFPLGMLYFILLITFFSVGLGLIPVFGLGLLFLGLTLALWLSFAHFERELALWWTGTDIPYVVISPPPGTSLLQRWRLRLTNPVTWKSLLFLLAKFPLGIFSFVSVLVALTIPLGLILEPLAYLIDIQTNQIFHLHSNSYTFSVFGLVRIGDTFQPIDFIGILLGIPIGFFLLICAFYAINGLTWGWGQLAKVLLGMSTSEQRLAEARTIAVQASTRAQQAEQSRKELIVNVGHELRTPIATIRGHVDSLLINSEAGKMPDAPELQSYLHIVDNEVQRLGTLVDDLLTLARADSHELRLDMAAVPAGEVVEEVYQTLAPLALRERQVTLVRQIANDLPLVWADRQRLIQVLTNLVRNAIIYTPAGGIVSIVLQRHDAATCALIVTDTGTGITPEDQARVFERFYRADASRTRASGGFGLGLAIVRDLVQAMGGSITLSSTPGEGSSFQVLLRGVAV